MNSLDDRKAITGNELEIIEFYIDEMIPGGERYRSYFGMNVAKVLEIIRIPPITGVPGKHHPAALGTFNLRGRVLPLVDLGLWLGKQNVDREADKVIVSEFSGVITAFIVSGVTRIHRMTWEQVEPPGKHLQRFSHESITGVVRLDDRIMFLLDMEQIIETMDPSLDLSKRIEAVQTLEYGTGYHVLVADDSASIRNTLARCLETANYTVSKASCGREAWDMLQAWAVKAAAEQVPLNHYVHLVISDIEMPEMDGHTLTRMIKQDPRFKNLPVILFSSLISEVVRQKGIQAGADDQIAKPDLPELTSRAKTLIERALADEDSA